MFISDFYFYFYFIFSILSIWKCYDICKYFFRIKKHFIQYLIGVNAHLYHLDLSFFSGRRALVLFLQSGAQDCAAQCGRKRTGKGGVAFFFFFSPLPPSIFLPSNKRCRHLPQSYSTHLPPSLCPWRQYSRGQSPRRSPCHFLPDPPRCRGSQPSLLHLRVISLLPWQPRRAFFWRVNQQCPPPPHPARTACIHLLPGRQALRFDR